MWRPIAYFYETKQTNQTQIIYDVHAIGNPILWWLSTIAIFLLLIKLIKDKGLKPLACANIKQNKHQNNWIASYILINYAANLLPWIKVTRCTFIYHYMGAYVFAWLALAWIVDNSLRSKYPQIGITIIILIILTFIFWLPIYFGFPLSPENYRLRMLFDNWI